MVKMKVNLLPEEIAQAEVASFRIMLAVMVKMIIDTASDRDRFVADMTQAIEQLSAQMRFDSIPIDRIDEFRKAVAHSGTDVLRRAQLLRRTSGKPN